VSGEPEVTRVVTLAADEGGMHELAWEMPPSDEEE